MRGSPGNEEPHSASGEDAEIEESLSGELHDSEPAVSARTEQVTQIVEAYSHQGPLPSEQWFTTLEGLHPGATGLILRDYAEERSHQRALQAEALEIDRETFRAFARYQTLRLLIAGGIALLIAVAGVVLIAMDKPITGLAVLTAEVAALVVAFFGRSRGSDGNGGDETVDGRNQPAPPTGDG